MPRPPAQRGLDRRRGGQVVPQHVCPLLLARRLRPAAAQGGAIPLPRLPARRAGGRLRRRRRAEDLLQVCLGSPMICNIFSSESTDIPQNI